MEIVSDPLSLKLILNEYRNESRSIGFVPTMGFLHEGHGSLIELAKNDSDICVVSIFVNPTQFGKGEDLLTYPRDEQADIKYCEELGVDIIFMPSVEDMYGINNSHSTFVSVNDLNKVLDGEFRPTHFDGVTTIVTKLLNIVGPCRCFMGMKDAQQVSIIYRMTKELFMDCVIVPCPVIRESSYLAMSSRNTYLSQEERENARAIYKALDEISQGFEVGLSNIDSLLHDGITTLTGANLEVQYLKLVEFETLKEVLEFDEGQYVLAAAVICGKTRLIDNFFIYVDENKKVFVDRGKVCEPS